VTQPVAVLYARRDSVYKGLPQCDVYDRDRDARNYRGWFPAIAHPPCRGWSRMRYFAKPDAGELELGPLAVEQVRAFGGVLEHPVGSLLWRVCNLPAPGKGDAFGFTFPISQSWFGHRAEKRTLLYISGIEPSQLPPFPLSIDLPSFTVSTSAKAYRKAWKREIPKRERDSTPPVLAEWLVHTAQRVYVNAHTPETPPRPNLCSRVLCDGEPCGLQPPCPDCGLALHDMPEGD
jgi:hypothetical protein